VMRSLVLLLWLLCGLCVGQSTIVYVNPSSTYASLPCGSTLATACVDIASALQSIPLVSSTSGGRIDIVLSSGSIHQACDVSLLTYMGSSTVRNITVRPVAGTAQVVCNSTTASRMFLVDVYGTSMTLNSLSITATSTVKVIEWNADTSFSTANLFNCVVSNASSLLSMAEGLNGYFVMTADNLTLSFIGGDTFHVSESWGVAVDLTIKNCVSQMHGVFLMLGSGSNNVVVDNCSITNGVDGFHVRPWSSLSVQNSIVSSSDWGVILYYGFIVFSNCWLNGARWVVWYGWSIDVYNSTIEGPMQTSSGLTHFYSWNYGSEMTFQDVKFKNIVADSSISNALFPVNIPFTLTFSSCTFEFHDLPIPLFGVSGSEMYPAQVLFEDCSFAPSSDVYTSLFNLVATGYDSSSFILKDSTFSGMQVEGDNLFYVETIWNILTTNCTFQNIVMTSGPIFRTKSGLTIADSYFSSISGTARVLLSFDFAGALSIQNSRFEFISLADQPALFMNKNGTVSLQNVTFSGVSALVTTAAIYMSTGTNLEVSNCFLFNFSNSHMIYQESFGTVYGSNVSFINSTGSSCVSMEPVSMATFNNTRFQSCNSNENGGAIFVDTSSSVMLKNSSFISNAALLNGGALYLADASSFAAVDGCLFSGNKAQNGGAMSLGDSSLGSILNSSFTNNNAVAFGGGIFVSSSTNWSQQNVQFIGNSAKTGGGMYYTDVTAGVSTQLHFKSNVASTVNQTLCNDVSGAGGGIFVKSLSYFSFVTNWINWTFVENSASSFGGAFGFDISDQFLASPSSLPNGFSFTSNSAQYGRNIGSTWKSVSVVLVTNPVMFFDDQAVLNFSFQDALNQSVVGGSCSFINSIFSSSPPDYFILGSRQPTILQSSSPYQLSVKFLFYRTFVNFPLANQTVNISLDLSLDNKRIKLVNLSVTLCNQGYSLISDQVTHYVCQPCYPGSFLSYGQAAYAICQECPPGKSSGWNATTCVNCTAGSFASSTGSRVCGVCGDGTYTSNGGNTVCEACPAGKITTKQGSTTCTPCPETSSTLNTGSTSLYSCVCSTGSYGKPWNGETCNQCRTSKGSQCKTNSSVPDVFSGYWRDLDTPDIIYQCIPSVACSQTAQDGDTECAAGYTGKRCGSCISPPYFHFDTYCKPCGDQKVAIGGWVVILLVSGYIVYDFLTRKQGRGSLEASLMFYSLQIVALYPRLIATWPNRVKFIFDGLSVLVMHFVSSLPSNANVRISTWTSSFQVVSFLMIIGKCKLFEYSFLSSFCS
jgi:predicted outer membrane repeat protein